MARQPNGKFLKQMGLLFMRGDTQSQQTNVLLNESCYARHGNQGGRLSGEGWRSDYMEMQLGGRDRLCSE